MLEPRRASLRRPTWLSRRVPESRLTPARREWRTPAIRIGTLIERPATHRTKPVLGIPQRNKSEGVDVVRDPQHRLDLILVDQVGRRQAATPAVGMGRHPKVLNRGIHGGPPTSRG